jgi:cell division protease FtsH
VMPGAEGVNFDDYRGQPELLEQAQQVVTLLRGVKAFENAGGEPLNGLLLEGPPGTGKTWLAQAISTEAGVPFFYVDTSSLQGMFMGTSTLKVSGMYRKARRAAKEYGAAVIFLDEIDSVGARGGVSSVGDNGRSGGMWGGMGSGGMGILSTLLIEMSGFGQEHGWRSRLRTWYYKTILRRSPPRVQKRVLTIGATNRIHALDPALLRPGRFDKKIRVDLPDMQGRYDIIQYYLTKVAHDETMDPAILATETPGYTPADIKYLLNEALRCAIFDGRTHVTYADFRRAQPEHEMGLRSPLKHLSKEARTRMAYYIAGKSVAVRLFLPENRIARISIVRQGYIFAHISHYPARESYTGLRTKEQHYNRLKTFLAGRAAEIEFAGIENQSLAMTVPTSVKTGMSDYEHFRALLEYMVSAGMFETLGGGETWQVSLMGIGKAWTPDQRRVMEEVYQATMKETREALRENANIVHELAKLLLEKDELLAEEIREFFDQYGLYTPEPSFVVSGQEKSFMTPQERKLLTEGDKPVFKQK